jgi:hypothetical protein
MRTDTTRFEHPYYFLECDLCDARFEFPEIDHPPREWVWLLTGAIAISLMTALAVSIWVGRVSTCADVRFDGEAICADGEPIQTWFHSMDATTILLQSGLAGGVMLPLAVATAAARMLWLLLLPLAYWFGISLGFSLGEGAVDRWCPGLYWENPDHEKFIGLAFCFGAPFMWALTALAICAAASNHSRWQLKRIQTAM